MDEIEEAAVDETESAWGGGGGGRGREKGGGE